MSDSKGNISNFSYDPAGNVTKFSEQVNGNSYTSNYTYDDDNKPKDMTFNGSKKLTYNYTKPNSTLTLGRLTGKTINTGVNDITTNYTYAVGGFGEKSTTNLLASIVNNNKAINYTYDANGNIETILENGKTIRYYYNELNEVTREDNQVLNKTIVYAYDAG